MKSLQWDEIYNETSTEAALQQLLETLRTVADKHAPTKTVRSTPAPWLDEELKSCMA